MSLAGRSFEPGNQLLTPFPGPFQAQERHFAAQAPEVADDGRAQHSAGSGHHHYLSLNVEQVIHNQ